MYILPLYINEVRGDFRLVSSFISHERLGAVIRFQRFLPVRRVSPALQGYTLGPAWQDYRWFPGAVWEIEAVSATGRRGEGMEKCTCASTVIVWSISNFSVGCMSGLRRPIALAWVSQEVRLGPKGVQKLPFVCLMVYVGVILSRRVMSQMLWCRFWNRSFVANPRFPEQDDLVIFVFGITLSRVQPIVV